MRSYSTLAILSLCGSCAQFTPSAAPASKAASASSCESLALIEDGEDADDRTLVRAGRGGYFYTYTDEEGSTIRPKDDKFGMSQGGANGSRYALRVKGSLAKSAQAFAGVGLNFVDPKSPYDVSLYQGLAFFAKRGSPEAASSVRMKLPDPNTDPEAGVCSECYNDFGVDFQISDEWTRYVIDFKDLSQQAGWGNPRPESIAPRVFGIQWQVSTSGAHYDLWIDDITFLGCP
jgi:endoglucanase